MDVAGGPGAEFLEAGFGVDGVVLPVAVAVDDDAAGNGGEEFSKALAFVMKFARFVNLLKILSFKVGVIGKCFTRY